MVDGRAELAARRLLIEAQHEHDRALILLRGSLADPVMAQRAERRVEESLDRMGWALEAVQRSRLRGGR